MRNKWLNFVNVKVKIFATEGWKSESFDTLYIGKYLKFGTKICSL